MKRTSFLCLVTVGIIAIALVAWWRTGRESSSVQQIKQRKSLVGSIAMQIDDLYSLQINGKRRLAVSCRYLGGDPNERCGLQAALLASPHGPELDYGIYGQSASPFKGEGVPVLWTFSKAPEHCAQFVLRITVIPEHTPPGSGTYSVDFVLPNFPKPYPG